MVRKKETGKTQNKWNIVQRGCVTFSKEISTDLG